MKQAFENPEAQRALVSLYSDSQAECKRNGCVGPEVGNFREKDQVFILKSCLGDIVRSDIDNALLEDCMIGAEKISMKHSGNKVGSQVKAKWTSADKSVQDAIRAMVAAEDSYYPHLLVTYMDVKEKRITIICVSKEQVKNTIKELAEAAFSVPKGNSRGIEYSVRAMQLFIQRYYFRVEIADGDVERGDDPDERRRKVLQSRGIDFEKLKIA
jgi:hypothetical protein